MVRMRADAEHMEPKNKTQKGDDKVGSRHTQKVSRHEWLASFVVGLGDKGRAREGIKTITTSASSSGRDSWPRSLLPLVQLQAS